MQHHRDTLNPALGWIILAGILCLTAAVYWPGLGGQFILDDHPNITINSAIQIENLDYTSLRAATLSADSGHLKRPVALLSFALNYYTSGLNPFHFKAVNIAIHLLNGITIFVLTQLIIAAWQRRSPAALSPRRTTAICLAVTALWLLHPINLTSVLYVVQRMTSLSALFVFAGLACYAKGRLRQLDGETGFHWIMTGLLLCGSLSLLSKENGALLPLFMFIVEITLFRFQTSARSSRNLLILFYVVTLLLPATGFVFFATFNMEWIMAGYAARDFGIGERLLTQSRALWYYLYLIVAPSNNTLGLYHDDFPISRSLFDPATTLPALLALAAVAGLAFAAIRRAPILSLGILLFLAAHLLESSIFALEIMYEHRNYFPSYPVLLAFAFYALSPQHRQLKIAGSSIVLFLAVLFAFVTTTRADIWGDVLDHGVFEAHSHPQSPRANMDLATKYAALAASVPGKADYYYQLAERHYLLAASLRRNYTSSLFGLIHTTCVLDKPVQKQWVDDLSSRLKTEPFWHNSINWFETLGDYNGKLGCTLNPGIMLTLINAALENTRITTRTRVLLLTTSSKYFSWRLKDFDTGLYLLAQASATAPDDPAPHTHLAILLNTMGRSEDARMEIETARSLDHLGRYSAELDKQESLLENAPLDKPGGNTL